MRKPVTTLLTVLPFLASCTDFNAAMLKSRGVEKEMSDAAKAERPVTVINEPYLLPSQISNTKESTPVALQVPTSILIARPTSLREAAGLVSETTGVPIFIEPDADVADEDDASPVFNGITLPPPPGVAVSSTTSTGGSQKARPWHGIGPWFRYSGTKAGLFDALALRFGVYAEFDGHTETFFKTQTKTFSIPGFNRDTKQNSTIAAVTGGGASSSSGGMSSGFSGGGSASGANSSGSGVSSGVTSVSSKSDTNVFKNMQKTAQSLIGDGKAFLDPDLGILTVSGAPYQIRRVERWVNALKSDLTQTVAISVHVYTLKNTNSSNYGFNPKLALKTAGQAYGLSLVPAAAPLVSSSTTPFSFGATVLSTAKGTAGQFSGSEIAVQALSEMGKVTEVYSHSAMTTNGIIVPFQNSINTTYLAQASAVTAVNAGTTASLTPGQVMSGFTGDVTPRVLSDNRIMLQLNFVLQTLLGIGEISSGDSKIQTPKTSSTSLDSTVVLHSGSTLVLTGYVDDASQLTRRGAGSAFNWLLGGGGDAQLSKTQIVVTVEAHTL